MAKNAIRVEDLLAYFMHHQARHTKIFNEESVRREMARSKYMTTIRARFFKCDFERSNVGHLGWLHTQWNSLINANSAMGACERAITKCHYHEKCDQREISWDFDEFSEDKFYSWCETNNIPY